ncbi:MAG: hypothetical protein ACFFCP_03915 [Promethearchaeota archaeon]
MTSRLVFTITEILKQSKESGEVGTGMLDTDMLAQLGFSGVSHFSIDRTRRINIAKIAIANGASISEIMDFMNWKDFEGFVAEILSENNFTCIESFRRRGNSQIHGMEIDVVGVRGRIIIAVDAKLWGVRGGKASALKSAAEKQKTRTEELANELHRLSAKLDLTEGVYIAYPMLVTWLVEEVELYEGVPVVPVFKLNSFILDFEQYTDLVVSFPGVLNFQTK